MGLTFWSDRTFHSNEMNDNQYHCALPLTSISKITSSMINKAFSSIGKMYGGGDGEEDVLLGKLFKDSGPTRVLIKSTKITFWSLIFQVRP